MVKDEGTRAQRQGIIFTDNIIANNTVDAPYSVLRLDLQDNALSKHVIARNTIRGNAIGVSTADLWSTTSAVTIVAEDTPASSHNYTITDNIFDNPGLDAELEVSMGSCYAGHVLDVRKNYWGSPDMTLAQVSTRVLDLLDLRG